VELEHGFMVLNVDSHLSWWRKEEEEQLMRACIATKGHGLPRVCML